jgi:hypothetical protein
MSSTDQSPDQKRGLKGKISRVLKAAAMSSPETPAASKPETEPKASLLKDLFGDGGRETKDSGKTQVQSGSAGAGANAGSAQGTGRGDGALDDAWTRIHKRKEDTTVLAIAPPVGKVDRLAEAALKSFSLEVVKRLKQTLADIGVDVGRVPAIEREDGGKAAKQHIDVAFQKWLAQKGVASKVKAITARLDGRRDLTDGRRLVLSAGYTLLLAEFLAGAGRDRETFSKLLRDDAGVADAMLFELGREGGLLDEYAAGLVGEVMRENRMRADGNAVDAVVRQVRAAL